MIGCATAWAAPVNPPPAHKLQGYAGYELKDVAFDPNLSDKKNVQKVVAKVDENMKRNVQPILQNWNASPNTKASQKIVIEPYITSLHKPSGATRFFAGAFAGDGHINVKVRIVEEPSGKVIAEPEFYRRANAMAGAWTVGGHDNAMLEKVTGLKEIAAKHLELKEGDGIALGMEFVLEALHQHSMVSKREEGVKTAYRDMLKAMFDHMSAGGDN